MTKLQDPKRSVTTGIQRLFRKEQTSTSVLFSSMTSCSGAITYNFIYYVRAAVDVRLITHIWDFGKLIPSLTGIMVDLL